jgi:hypothetical protein
MATWDTAAKVLLERAGWGWEGIWALTYAAGRATAALGMVAPMVDAVELTYAAMDLREAREELEWVRPDLPTRCPAVTIGLPNTADDDVAREGITGLITAALTRAETLLCTDLDLGDLAGLTRTIAKLDSARRTVGDTATRSTAGRGRP